MDGAGINMGEVWLVVLVAALVAFAGMLVLCGIRGAGDIVSLFRTLKGDDGDGAEGSAVEEE